MIKRILKYSGVFVALTVIFFGIMVLGCSFPSELIRKNVIESSKVLLNDGMFPWVGTSIIDNGVDALMINESYSVDYKRPVFSALSCRKNYNPEMTKVEMGEIKGDIMTFHLPKEQIELIEIDGLLYSKDKRENIEVEGESFSIDKTSYKVEVNGNVFYRNKYNSIKELDKFLSGDVDTSIEYARYWHGYLPIIRTLLLIFNILEIRILIMISLNIMLIYLLKLLTKNFDKKVSVIMCFSLIVYNYIFVGYSLSASQIFLIMMIASIILIKKIEAKKEFDFNLYMFIVGMLTNFLDYLTVPIVTLGLPSIIYFLYKKEELTDIKKCIFSLMKTCISWGLGYGLTFLSKWIIYDLLFDKNMLLNGIRQVLFRTTGEVIEATQPALPIIITILLGFVFLACLSYIAFTYEKYDVTRKENMKAILKKNLIFILIGLMPLAWHIVLGNHTIIHWKFHYRDMFLMCATFLIIFNDCFEIVKKKK